MFQLLWNTSEAILHFVIGAEMKLRIDSSEKDAQAYWINEHEFWQLKKQASIYNSSEFRASEKVMGYVRFINYAII